LKLLIGFLLLCLWPASVLADALDVTQRWSIDGTPLGTERALEPSFAANSSRVFISGSIQTGDRRRQVIRVFDAATGRIVQTLENPSGKDFEGFGEAIAVNDRFLVTGVHRRRDGSQTNGGLLVFDAQTGDLLREIPNPRAGEASFFGQIPPVLVDNRILASVTLTEDGISSAWVFSAETGEILLTIEEPDVPSSLFSKPKRSLFGRSLAMDANHIAIGGNDRSGPEGLGARGLIHVFDATTGKQLHRIEGPGSEKSSNFGLPMLLEDGLLYASELDEAGSLNWPTGAIHAIDPKTAEVNFSVTDPIIPQSYEDVAAGVQGTGLGTTLAVRKGLLFLGLPEWSGTARSQGGLMILDAATGEKRLTYQHRTGEEAARFGQLLTASSEGVVIGQEFKSDKLPALRVIFFDVN
jgi:outer membrane protein assembly factor BamB